MFLLFTHLLWAVQLEPPLGPCPHLAAGGSVSRNFSSRLSKNKQTNKQTNKQKTRSKSDVAA